MEPGHRRRHRGARSVSRRRPRPGQSLGCRRLPCERARVLTRRARDLRQRHRPRSAPVGGQGAGRGSTGDFARRGADTPAHRFRDARERVQSMSRARLMLGLLGLFGAAAVAFAQSTPSIDIVPRPASLEMRTGGFVINAETRIVAGDKESRRVAHLFKDYLLAQHGLRLEVSATRAGRRNAISFDQSGSRELPEEGYLLNVGPEGVRVTGRHAGLFYGMQTLTQLLPLELQPTIELPALEIADHPRFGYRGLLLDVGRHFFTVEYVKKLLDLAAQYKINRFHWHLTDDQGWRIEIRRYPKLTQA